MKRLIRCPTCGGERALVACHPTVHECGSCARRRVWQGRRLIAASDLVRQCRDIVDRLQGLLAASGPTLMLAHDLTRMDDDLGRLANDVMAAQLTPIPVEKMAV